MPAATLQSQHRCLTHLQVLDAGLGCLGVLHNDGVHLAPQGHSQCQPVLLLRHLHQRGHRPVHPCRGMLCFCCCASRMGPCSAASARLLICSGTFSSEVRAPLLQRQNVLLPSPSGMSFCRRAACYGSACHIMWAVWNLIDCFVHFSCPAWVCMLDSKMLYPKHMLMHAPETSLR